MQLSPLANGDAAGWSPASLGSRWFDCNAVMRPNRRAKVASHSLPEEPVWLALFTGLPDWDRNSFEEPALEAGYERQPMPLALTRARYKSGEWVNAETHCFLPSRVWKPVRWAGLIDAAGECRMYAPLGAYPRPVLESSARAIVFTAGTILLLNSELPRC